MNKFLIAGAAVVIFGVMSITAFAASTYKPVGEVNTAAGYGAQNAQCINGENCNSEDCSGECDCDGEGIGNEEAVQNRRRMNSGTANGTAGNCAENGNCTCTEQEE